jgi:hypothetical protein
VDPLAYDDSKITHTRDVSYKPEMYYQWSTYRLETLAARCTDMAAKLREKHDKKQKYEEEVVDVEAFKVWAEEQIAYFERTAEHMV